MQSYSAPPAALMLIRQAVAGTPAAMSSNHVFKNKSNTCFACATLVFISSTSLFSGPNFREADLGYELVGNTIQSCAQIGQTK